MKDRCPCCKSRRVDNHKTTIQDDREATAYICEQCGSRWIVVNKTPSTKKEVAV